MTDESTDPISLPAILESLDGAPEGTSQFYEEFKTKSGDIRYRPRVAEVDGWGLQNFQGLRHSLASTRGERDSARSRLEEYTAAIPEEMTAGQVAEALAELNRLREAGPAEGGGPDVQAQIDTATAALRKQINDLKSQYGDREKAKDVLIEKLTSRAEVAAACAKHGAKESVIWPMVRDSLRTDYAEGQDIPVVRVLDENRNIRTTTDAEGDGGMTVDELVGVVLRSEFPELYKGHGGSGAGVNAGNGSGGNNETSTSSKEWEISQRQLRALPPEQRFAHVKAAKKAAQERGLAGPTYID